MNLIEGFKIAGYRFILFFLIIIISLFIIGEIVESVFFSWINIIITFIVIIIFISKILSIVSGWQRLEKTFSLDTKNIFKSMKIKFKYGFIDKYPYPLHLSYYEHGILIRVFILLKFSHKDLMISWNEISKIIIRKALNPERKINILDKIYDIGSNKLYAEIKLKKFEDIKIELPWIEKFKQNVPKDIKVEVRD